MALPKLDTPTYALSIPSSGASAEFRPFTVKEQKQLLLAKESNDEGNMIRTVRDLISSCLFGVEPNDLTLFDFEYIFMRVRAKSVGETSDVRIACTECEKFTDVSINIEEAQIGGDIRKGKDLKIELTDDVGLVMRYPRFETMINLLQKKNTETQNTFETIIDCIDLIYDKDNMYHADEHTREELVEFVDSLPSNALQKISEFFSSSPEVVLNVKFDCSSCGVTNEKTIKGLKNFF